MEVTGRGAAAVHDTADSHEVVAGVDIVLLGRGGAADELFVALADVGRGAAAVGLDEAVETGVVGKSIGGAALDNGLGLVEGIIRDRAAVAGEHVAVGVAGKGRIHIPAYLRNSMRLGAVITVGDGLAEATVTGIVGEAGVGIGGGDALGLAEFI